MKIVIDKVTGKIGSFASGDKTDFSYLDSATWDVKIIEGDSLPDRIEALKFIDGKIVIDANLKKEAEKEDKKRQIIETKKAEILEKQAIQKAIDEGLLNPNGSLI